MTETKVREERGVNPEPHSTPPAGVRQKGSNLVKLAHKLGFWWVKTEDEALNLVAWEVAR